MESNERTIEEILNNFHPEDKYALAILHDIQKEYGYISSHSLKAVAKYLDTPISKIFSLATFYDAYSIEKKGRFVIQICNGTTCHAEGSQDILNEIEEALGIKAGETTSDGLFSIEIVHCFGTCAMAPVVACDNTYFGNIKKEQGKEIVKKYKEKVEI